MTELLDKKFFFRFPPTLTVIDQADIPILPAIT